MFIKNALLTVFLLLYCNSICASQQINQQANWQWLKSFFITPIQETTPQKGQAFQKAVANATVTGKPLDLATFYKQKEEKSMIDPIESADRFKQAINNAANKNSIMTRFKNNPKKFLFGASSSSYQYEGDLDSNNANAIFYETKGFEPAGKAIDFWNRYATDIAQMKRELGINCFRLSIAWERVQPNKNVWDLEMIKKYVVIIKTLQENGIEPIIVFHHYTIPQWFAEIGGFEKYENIKYFVAFTKKMYEALHKEVTYWSTFNAIEGYAFKGYYTLDGPPGKQKNLLKTQQVMYNMLAAHGATYKAIKILHKKYSKKQPEIPNPQIGIQKNIVLLDPSDTRFKTSFVTTFGTALQNKMIFSLLYNRYHNAIDWIGVNIYSNMLMTGTVRDQEMEEERKTENHNYRDYPEGIYRAVKIVNNAIAQPLNIPIIITENGIATKNDDYGNNKRIRFFRRALYTIRKLIEEGCPIIGYTPWASHDNYEWPSAAQPDPYDRPYGMFAVDFTKENLPRTLKKGAEYYRDFIKHYFNPTLKLTP